MGALPRAQVYDIGALPRAPLNPFWKKGVKSPKNFEKGGRDLFGIFVLGRETFL